MTHEIKVIRVTADELGPLDWRLLEQGLNAVGRAQTIESLRGALYAGSQLCWQIEGEAEGFLVGYVERFGPLPTQYDLHFSFVVGRNIMPYVAALRDTVLAQLAEEFGLICSRVTFNSAHLSLDPYYEKAGFVPTSVVYEWNTGQIGA